MVVLLARREGEGATSRRVRLRSRKYNFLGEPGPRSARDRCTEWHQMSGRGHEHPPKHTTAGGKRNCHDLDPEDTALRELYEETGGRMRCRVELGVVTWVNPSKYVVFLSHVPVRIPVLRPRDPLHASPSR